VSAKSSGIRALDVGVAGLVSSIMDCNVQFRECANCVRILNLQIPYINYQSIKIFQMGSAFFVISASKSLNL
jgi:hypothetical protein